MIVLCPGHTTVLAPSGSDVCVASSDTVTVTVGPVLTVAGHAPTVVIMRVPRRVPATRSYMRPTHIIGFDTIGSGAICAGGLPGEV